MRRVFVPALLILFGLVGVDGAFAHGEHGDAAPPAGSSPVTVDGFQVELLTAPQPPRVGAPSQIIAKILRSGSLEAANVDLAHEFTDLIISQRSFQANARVISVSNDLLDGLVRLI